MTYLSYISSGGSLIVKRYLGELDMQTTRQHMRQLIGTFDAPDIERARAIANQLRKATS